jgi:nucleoside-diphosphate-sugar epimerase
VNIYGRSKESAEKYVLKARESGLRTAVVRFSNVFGSVHDYPDRVIPAFCRAAVFGTPIRVDGSENVFDFTYLGDVIQGVLSFIHLLSRNASPIPPIHLTSGRPMSLGEVAKIAQEASEHPIEIVEKPSRTFDVSRFWGDPSRAREWLKWKAAVSLEDGMQRLIDQYRLVHNTPRTLVMR